MPIYTLTTSPSDDYAGIVKSNTDFPSTPERGYSESVTSPYQTTRRSLRVISMNGKKKGGNCGQSRLIKNPHDGDQVSKRNANVNTKVKSEEKRIAVKSKTKPHIPTQTTEEVDIKENDIARPSQSHAYVNDLTLDDSLDNSKEPAKASAESPYYTQFCIDESEEESREVVVCLNNEFVNAADDLASTVGGQNSSVERHGGGEEDFGAVMSYGSMAKKPSTDCFLRITDNNNNTLATGSYGTNSKQDVSAYSLPNLSRLGVYHSGMELKSKPVAVQTTVSEDEVIQRKTQILLDMSYLQSGANAPKREGDIKLSNVHRKRVMHILDNPKRSTALVSMILRNNKDLDLLDLMSEFDYFSS